MNSKGVQMIDAALRRLIARMRRFDYGDLRFLYIACLLSIALVYTVFRASQFFMNRAELRALDAIQLIDVQRDLTSEMERHIAYAQNRTSRQYPITVQHLVDLYSEAQHNHRQISASSGLRKGCANRACRSLFTQDFFADSPKQLYKDLLNSHLNATVHNSLLQMLFDEVVRYRVGLRDTLALSFDVIRAKNRTNLFFEVLAYFSLIALLFAQAVYVFRPAIRRLNDSLSVRSDFLSRISHEIRNPMNSIIGMADILKGTKLNYEQQQYVGNLIRSGNALLDMLNNLIDFSVIEGGRVNLKPAPFDLFRSLDRDINLISIPAHHKNINVYVDVDPRVPNRLVADCVRLDQVLVNLLNNAVKFTEQGHVRLSVDLENETDKTVGLLFAVTDTGIGIRREQLDEVFESFVQGDSSIQRKYGGSGLGLSISREIIRLMGGHLNVESTFGHGSRFYFSLAFNKQTERPGQEERPMRPLAGRHFLFLTAPPEAQIYRSQLERLGCIAPVLGTAPALAQALALPASKPLSEILIDDSVGIISMINCRNIAAERNLGDRCIALVRSNLTKENMDLLRRNGFTRFLIKPLKPWELLTLPPPESGAESEPTLTLPAPSKPLVERLRERNLKILLVDDSNDNLFLLKELVSPVAAQVHFAENGLEALEKFSAQSFDAIFMDIQMPVMDGYTAIRKIRQLERGPGPGVPVFAVTAHAGLVDAQKCREAGFTDRIVKPVVREDIYNSLARAFHLDETEIEVKVMDALPAKYLQKLMPTYFQTRESDVEKLRAALAAKDFKALKALGHKIKGSSASYGFAKTSELSLDLEQAAGNENLDRCAEIVRQLADVVNADRQRLLPETAHAASPSPRAISPDAIS